MQQEQSGLEDEAVQQPNCSEQLNQQGISQEDHEAAPRLIALHRAYQHQGDQAFFVKAPYPSALKPFVHSDGVDPSRLPAIKNFAKPANHLTPILTPAPEHDAEERPRLFCICKAKASWLDADNGRYTQCYDRNCAKWFHRRCVEYEEPEDWRERWLCPECQRRFEAAEEACEECETEEEIEVTPKPKRKKRKKPKRN